MYLLSKYWFYYLSQLTPDPDGFYNFNAVREDSLNDLEKGKLAYHRGRFSQAIAHIERHLALHRETEEALFWLAVCYMRQAEAENCLSPLLNGNHSHASFCSLPLARFHDRPALARKAAKLFEELLERCDGSNRLYRWLLNYNYMVVNGFPQEAPEKYRISSQFIDVFYGARRKEVEAKYSWLSFEDRAQALNIAGYGTGRGVAVEDFDKDGYLDIIVASQYEGLKYYRNIEGRTFQDVTAKSGLAGVKQPFTITAADYDNDGWIDLFVSVPFRRFQLFRNQGNGTFTDVTATAFPFFEHAPRNLVTSTWTSAWADIDNDGDLDLLLTQSGVEIPFLGGLWAQPRMGTTLFVNEGGCFMDRTREYGLSPTVKDRLFIGAAFGDYDGDGYPDLFLSSFLGDGSVLLRNAGGKRFEKADVLPSTEPGFMAAFLDVNHDGRLDIFQGAYADARTSTGQAVYDDGAENYRSGHSTILLQMPNGRFEKRNDFFDMPIGTMGVSYGDLNNDGCYDFYLGTGNPEGWFVLPHLMYLGELQGTECAGRWTNVSMLSGLGNVQKGHGIVFFDFNNDGKQDIYSALGGMWPGDGWPNQFFVNTSAVENSWVKIRLRGRKTNYFGVGARIKVTAVNQEGKTIVRHYVVDNKTGFGSAPYLAHIGLLNAVTITGIEVYWPASRCRHSYPGRIRELNTLDEQECFS